MSITRGTGRGQRSGRKKPNHGRKAFPYCQGLVYLGLKEKSRG